MYLKYNILKKTTKKQELYTALIFEWLTWEELKQLQDNDCSNRKLFSYDGTHTPPQPRKVMGCNPCAVKCLLGGWGLCAIVTNLAKTNNINCCIVYSEQYEWMDRQTKRWPVLDPMAATQPLQLWIINDTTVSALPSTQTC